MLENQLVELVQKLLDDEYGINEAAYTHLLNVCSEFPKNPHLMSMFNNAISYEGRRTLRTYT